MILPPGERAEERMKNVCVCKCVCVCMCHCSAVKHCYEHTHSIKTHPQSLVMTVYLCLHVERTIGSLQSLRSCLNSDTHTHTHSDRSQTTVHLPLSRTDCVITCECVHKELWHQTHTRTQLGGVEKGEVDFRGSSELKKKNLVQE